MCICGYLSTSNAKESKSLVVLIYCKAYEHFGLRKLMPLNTDNENFNIGIVELCGTWSRFLMLIDLFDTLHSNHISDKQVLAQWMYQWVILTMLLLLFVVVSKRWSLNNGYFSYYYFLSLFLFYTVVIWLSLNAIDHGASSMFVTTLDLIVDTSCIRTITDRVRLLLWIEGPFLLGKISPRTGFLWYAILLSSAWFNDQLFGSVIFTCAFYCDFKLLMQMIVTCLSILAVDFGIFPRRYAKTETYGTGLVSFFKLQQTKFTFFSIVFVSNFNSCFFGVNYFLLLSSFMVLLGPLFWLKSFCSWFGCPFNHWSSLQSTTCFSSL